MSHQQARAESDSPNSSDDDSPRNDTISPDLPTLILTSHSHSPPLLPPPELKCDVRSLPNPPKYIRDSYTGHSPRLREWLKSDPLFNTRRDGIRQEIQDLLSKTINKDNWQKPTGSGSLIENNDEIKIRDVQEANPPTSTEIQVRVGISCAMGKHRSVAMVEELAILPWPGWQVCIVHRDLTRKRNANKRTAKGSKRNAFLNHGDQFQ